MKSSKSVLVGLIILTTLSTGVLAGYTFGKERGKAMKLGNAKNEGVPVRLIGKVEKIGRKSLLLTIFKPEEDRKSTKKIEVKIKINAKTKFSKVETQKKDSGIIVHLTTRKISHTEVRRGKIVSVIAKLVAGGELEAQEIALIPSAPLKRTFEEIVSETRSFENNITIRGTVKNIANRKLLIETAGGGEITVLVDEETSYSKGILESETRPQKGSLADIKLGKKIIVGGISNVDGNVKAMGIFIEE